VSQLLALRSQGNEAALDKLIPLVYPERLSVSEAWPEPGYINSSKYDA